jgi:threonine/homoserine/homoserine lactone efflux protein
MSQHDEIISGSITSISLFVISVFPTISEWAHGLDVFVVLIMHTLQAFAALAAIIVAYHTLNKLIRERRNNTFK